MKNKLKENNNLLISFKSIQEISEECIGYVDILDLKDPLKGSIGSWKVNKLKKVISKFGKKKRISATLGDENKIDHIMIKLKQFDDLNLDYIKFGIFCENTEELNTLFNSLKNKRFETELVPVIFVENTFMREYIFNHFLKFKNLGFNFLLLDTYSKTKKNLIEVCSIKYLKILLENSLKAKLGLGLAGKLGLSDVSKLVELKPKIMGFRSAVCKEENRNSFLSVSKVKTLYHSIHNSRRCAIQVAGA